MELGTGPWCPWSLYELASQGYYEPAKIAQDSAHKTRSETCAPDSRCSRKLREHGDIQCRTTKLNTSERERRVLFLYLCSAWVLRLPGARKAYPLAGG